jgi:hypothetical protein
VGCMAGALCTNNGWIMDCTVATRERDRALFQLSTKVL